MKALSASDLLSVWERGARQSSTRQALLLLAMAWPDTSTDEWALVSIGQRDGFLLTLREELFGTRLEAVAICPKCEEQLELDFSTQDIRAAVPASPSPGSSLQVDARGYEVQFSLPTSADLIEIAKPAEAGGRETLLERCVAVSRLYGTAVDPATMPDEVTDAIVSEMARADPQAEVQVALVCSSCRHNWSMAFDILSFLCNEIDDWAQRILREVCALASSFGWSEGDILAMSANRRRLYLDLIGA
jgi:hypothetical protein